MTEQKTPVDKALDLFFFAPIGLALNAEEMVKQMAARGRQSVAAARFIGEMAVAQGRTEIDKTLLRLQDQAAEWVDQLSGMAGGGPAASPAPTGSTRSSSSEPTPVTFSEVLAEAEPTLRSVAGGGPDGADGGGPSRPVPANEDVNAAIPDFDSLAASQVVPRLAGLSLADLEAVRRYETAHRGRKTIINRIDQLQRS